MIALIVWGIVALGIIVLLLAATRIRTAASRRYHARIRQLTRTHTVAYRKNWWKETGQ